MSLRRPFRAPRSNSKLAIEKAIDVELDEARKERAWMVRRGIGPQYKTVEVDEDILETTTPVARDRLLVEEEPNSPVQKDVANHEEDNTTPISQWAVSEDEDDLVPISQLLVIGKAKQISATVANVSELYVDAQMPPLFRKGHENLGKSVAKFFNKVLHFGTVKEIIPRRKGFHYGVTYQDEDKEDMDDEELQYALELKHKHDVGDEVVDEAEAESDIAGLSEEGSVYDSEEDRKEIQKQKKRKALEDNSKRAGKKKTNTKSTFKVRLEDIANIGGPDSMLGKSMSRL
jgi:hypothetical protein